MIEGNRVVLPRVIDERLRTFQGSRRFTRAGTAPAEHREPCAACGSRRHRTVHLVRDEGTGEVWRVGRLCAAVLCGEVQARPALTSEI